MLNYRLAIALAAALVTQVAIAADGVIRGTVANVNNRAEAGVWVIAETDDLPTNFRKIVVTDDAGRFVLPELPAAEYAVWVRGYGLLDSAKIAAKPGDNIELEVRTASSSADAARIYPANYWTAMMEVPSQAALKDLEHTYDSPKAWSDQFKLNCIICHQPGSAMTRVAGREVFDHGLKKTALMDMLARQLNRDLTLDVLEQWGNQIAAGKTPDSAPPRPQGIERNFVITQWQYGERYTYAHDIISTDKRNPSLYPEAKIYGLDIGNDHLLIMDPKANSWEKVKLPTWENAKPWCEQTYKPLGSEEIVPVGAEMLGCPVKGVETMHPGAYSNAVNPHNPMFDDSGKVWITMQIRREWGEDLPDFCQKDPFISSYYHHRQLGYYDTKTGEIVPVDTCFGAHHLQFDDKGVLWVNGDDRAVGWLDTRVFDPKRPQTLQAAMGWSEAKIDTDGDGEADTPIIGFRYSIIPNPVAGDVWLAIPPGSYGKFPSYGKPGYLMRYDPKTDTHEAYTPPFPAAGARGIDVDSKGNIWAGMAGSGHLARFDRSACKQNWGSGDQCPEGWTLWQTPGPNLKGIESSGSADFHYYTWVDQFDTLGMGPDTVFINGTNSDSLIAFRPDTEEFTVIRIPYPMVAFTRGLDGRIDDSAGGWKGRGLWFTNGLDPIMYSEVPRTYVGHVQLRPSPLDH